MGKLRFDDLSDVERGLVDAVLNGDRFDLSDGAPISTEDMMSWGDERVVSAMLIRQMLSGVFDWPDDRRPDPLGVRLRGVRLEGQLFLTDVDAALPLVVLDCITTEPVVLVRAHLSMALITRLVAPAVHAQSVRVDHDFQLTDGQIGALVMDQVTIGGRLDLSGTRVANSEGPAFRAKHLHVGADLELRRFCAAGVGASGAVDISGSVVDGSLDLGEAQLDNPSGPALQAQLLRCRGYVFLTKDCYARGAGDAGAVNFIGAEIGGQLNLSGAQLVNLSGPAIAADKLNAESDVILTELRAEGGGALGTIRLVNAKIGGMLDLSGAQLINPTGPVVQIGHANVVMNVLLNDGFRAHGRSDAGAVNAMSANIGGQLDLTDAQIANDCGPAVAADGLHTGGQVLFAGRFRAEGTGERGAVQLVAASIDGPLGFIGAYLSNPDGPALSVYGINVAGDVVFREGFRAQGNNQNGAIQMGAARIGKDLSFDGGRVRSLSQEYPALVLERTQVTGYLRLPASTACHSEAACSAKDEDHEWVADGRIEFDGLTYQGVPRNARLVEWLEMLRERTATYAAQPYRQLAEAHLAAGHEEDVRRIRIAQQEDILRRGELSRRGKLWHLIKRHTVRYGYQPSRALLWLLITLLLSLGVTVLAGSFGLVVHTPAYGGAGTVCSPIEQTGFVLDRAIPIVTIDGQQRCQISPTSGWSTSVTAATWTLRILGWAFASLFLVGLTSVIRRPT